MLGEVTKHCYDFYSPNFTMMVTIYRENKNWPSMGPHAWYCDQAPKIKLKALVLGIVTKHPKSNLNL